MSSKWLVCCFNIYASKMMRKKKRGATTKSLTFRGTPVLKSSPNASGPLENQGLRANSYVELAIPKTTAHLAYCNQTLF